MSFLKANLQIVPQKTCATFVTSKCLNLRINVKITRQFHGIHLLYIEAVLCLRISSSREIIPVLTKTTMFSFIQIHFSAQMHTRILSLYHEILFIIM